MSLLAIDTSSDRCAVLVRSAAADIIREESLARGHDARLAPMAREALAAAGLEPRDLSRVAVAVGPGSFTGVRVGVAFARGLALALRIPAVGILGLDALAAAAPPGSQRLVAAVHDAKRGEIVWRAYRDRVPLTEPICMALEETAGALDTLRGQAVITLVGSGSPLLAAPGRIDGQLARFPLLTLADLGAAADPARALAEPFYHRPPDATPAKLFVRTRAATESAS
jgi:tRNA threonylcarbamoyladenosine biosynthesis protein TsaB